MIEVVSIMEDMMKLGNTQVHLLNSFRNVTLSQYTMSGTPQQNDVSERRNRTSMDMIRSMLNNSTLLIPLWMYALKTTMYLY